MNRSLFIFLLLLFGCNSKTQIRTVGKDSVDIYTVQADDEDMNNAIHKAKITLDLFDSALYSNDTNFNSFTLKVKFLYGKDNAEHIWVADVYKDEEEYVGIVNNEPEHISGIKFGDTIIVKKNDITDWMYLDKDFVKGGFTMKLLRSRMSAAERAEMDSASYYKFEK